MRSSGGAEQLSHPKRSRGATRKDVPEDGTRVKLLPFRNPNEGSCLAMERPLAEEEDDDWGLPELDPVSGLLGEQDKADKMDEATNRLDFAVGGRGARHPFFPCQVFNKGRAAFCIPLEHQRSPLLQHWKKQQEKSATSSTRTPGSTNVTTGLASSSEIQARGDGGHQAEGAKPGDQYHNRTKAPNRREAATTSRARCFASTGWRIRRGRKWIPDGQELARWCLGTIPSWCQLWRASTIAAAPRCAWVPAEPLRGARQRLSVFLFVFRIGQMASAGQGHAFRWWP